MNLDIHFLAILIVIFILFATANYFLLPEIINKIKANWEVSEKKVVANLESLFIRNPEAVARKFKLGCVVLLTALGFWLPASFSNLDEVILDNAVRLNKQALYDEAILLVSGFKKGSSPLLHNELGVAYLGVNDVDSAVRNFEIAIEILPEYARAHANLAVANKMLDNHEEAEFQNRRAEDYFRSKVDKSLIYGQTSSSGVIVRIIAGLVFFIISLGFPRWLTNFLCQRREKKYNTELADSLKMLSNSLKAGMSLLQSIEMMVDQSKGVVKQEFELVLKEHQLGLSLTDALLNLKKRMPIEDNVMLVDTVALLTETGGNIPQAIENVVHTITERKRINDKISAMTAEGKVQTIILFCIPFFIGFFMNTAQKESFSLMYTTIIGWICMIVMFVWGLLGVFFMLKITRVKI